MHRQRSSNSSRGHISRFGTLSMRLMPSARCQRASVSRPRPISQWARHITKPDGYAPQALEKALPILVIQKDILSGVAPGSDVVDGPLNSIRIGQAILWKGAKRYGPRGERW